MLQTLLGRKKYKERMSDEQPHNQDNLKRSINNTFITISTHVYVNNQN